MIYGMINGILMIYRSLLFSPLPVLLFPIQIHEWPIQIFIYLTFSREEYNKDTDKEIGKWEIFKYQFQILYNLLHKSQILQIGYNLYSWIQYHQK